MKYIDSEKLLAEIKKIQHSLESRDVRLNQVKKIRTESMIEFCKCITDVIDSLQQKQSGVDLEKFTEKINTFQARYKHPEITSIKGAMAFMARMFYQYPNVAREWYESLPKATMD